MRNALVLLVLCTFGAAMVSRNRRALDINTESATEDATSPKNSTVLPVCAPHTPCSWEIYKRSSKIIDTAINNSYCTCGIGTTCQEYELDANLGYNSFRCMEEKNDEKTVES